MTSRERKRVASVINMGNGTQVQVTLHAMLERAQARAARDKARRLARLAREASEIKLVQFREGMNGLCAF